MATHDYVIDNSTGANVRADINNALAAIVSNNSSSSEPSTKYAYMWWADTTTGILKIRNSANDGWVELLQLDGTLTLEDGSASTPGLAFRDDLNTGIFSSAADTFNVATAGVERMELGATTIFNEDGADVDFRIEGDTDANLFHVDAGNDRIGISTSTPDSLFHVFAGSAGSISAAASAVITLEKNGDTALQFLSPSSNNQEIRFGDESDNGSGYILYSHASNFLSFGLNGGSEKMRIISSGNVGVGVTDPDQSLEVAGVVAANDLMVGRLGDRFPVIQRHTASSGSQSLTICAGSGLSTFTGTEPAINDTTAGAGIRLSAGDPTSDPFGGGIRYFANGSTSPNNPGTGNQHVFYRRTAANTFTEAVRITHSGHFKASTNASYQSITGTFHESHTDTNNQHIHWFQHDGSNSGQQFGIRVRTTNDGNDGNTLLQVSSGSATAGAITRAGSFSSRNNSYGGTSDIKLKENIVDAKSQWDDIKAIKFRNFNFKDNPSKKMLGVVAQEIELVSAGLVEDVIDRDPDTNEDLGTVTKHVKSSILYMKAMKCLQEAIAKIEVLETKVAALEAA